MSPAPAADAALQRTDLPFPLVARGKVRDVYDVGGDRLLIVATDRISAYDVVLPRAIPDKGMVLTQVTVWWLKRLGAAQPHHLIACDADEIVAALPEKVWVSFDVDGLDPRFCPGTGTPVPGGLDFQEANHILRRLALSKRTIVGFDLNEVAPHPSGESEWDASVGARLLYKMSAWTLVSQGLRTPRG